MPCLHLDRGTAFEHGTKWTGRLLASVILISTPRPRLPSPDSQCSRSSPGLLAFYEYDSRQALSSILSAELSARRRQ